MLDLWLLRENHQKVRHSKTLIGLPGNREVLENREIPRSFVKITDVFEIPDYFRFQLSVNLDPFTVTEAFC